MPRLTKLLSLGLLSLVTGCAEPAPIDASSTNPTLIARSKPVLTDYRAGAPAPNIQCSDLEEAIERAKCIDPAVRDAVAEYERAEKWTEDVMTDGQRFWVGRTSTAFEDTLEECGLTAENVGDGAAHACVVEKLGAHTGEILRLFAANTKTIEPFSAVVADSAEARTACAAFLPIDDFNGDVTAAKWSTKAKHGDLGDAVYVFLAEAVMSLHPNASPSRLFWLHRDDAYQVEDWFVLPAAADADAFAATWVELIAVIAASDAPANAAFADLVASSRHPSLGLSRAHAWPSPADTPGATGPSAPQLFDPRNTPHHRGEAPYLSSVVLIGGVAHVTTVRSYALRVDGSPWGYDDRALFAFGNDGTLTPLCWSRHVPPVPPPRQR